MQFPAENAAPFEFARPILLLAALGFFAGFSGYLAIHPPKAVAVRDALARPAAGAPTANVSLPAANGWNYPKHI
jgi:hypothetical protein